MLPVLTNQFATSAVLEIQMIDDGVEEERIPRDRVHAGSVQANNDGQLTVLVPVACTLNREKKAR